MRFFNFLKSKPVVIELDPLEFRAESVDQATLAALWTHPGFQFLVKKLRIQRRMLEQQLVNGTHTDIRSVDRLQAAIAGAKWMENQVAATFNKEQRKERDMTTEEEQLFNQSLANFIEVGR